MELEQLHKLAQQYISQIPLIVLGSGSSAGYGLPTMWALADELLRLEFKDEKDIECWGAFKASIQQTKDLEKTLEEVQLTDHVIDSIITRTWEFISNKDLNCFFELIKNNTKFPLSELFGYLLRTSRKRITIVTTNYDRLAEYAASYAGGYTYTYFTNNLVGKFIEEQDDKLATIKGYKGVVNVCKVHGSLDWYRNSNGDIVSIPLQIQIPAGHAPCIVTPGVDKFRKTYNHPYRPLFAEIDREIKAASSILCIGYGFNDEHVHPKLLQRVFEDKVPVVILTKKLTPHTRKLLLDKKCEKFLFLEENDGGGTLVYSQHCPTGAVFQDESFWQLNNFLTLIK